MRFRIFLKLSIVLILTFVYGCSSSVQSDKSSVIKKAQPEKYTGAVEKKINGKEYIQVTLPLGKFGGTLNLPLFGSGPKTFNPWASTDATSSELAGLMYDSLFSDDPVTGEIKPKLAKSYEILDGGKKVIVKLRDGIKWSDGKEITADDVVFTWNEIVFKGLEGSGFSSLVLIDGKYPEVNKIDSKTVEFKIHTVFAPFVRQISYPPAPKHIVEKVIAGKSKEDAKKDFLRFWGADSDPSSLVTNGPFKLSRYVEGERVELVKNPNYYFINSEGKSLPYVDRVVYSIVQDKSFELFKFIAGELDQIGLRGEDVALATKLQPKKNFNIVNLGPTTSTEFLLFNLSKDEKKKSRSWFNNDNFRKAVSYSIDRKGIVDNVLAGIGKPLFTPESHASIFINKEISEGYPQDLDEAKKLLLESGFKYDSKNKLVDKNGEQVTFTILTNAENTNRQAIGVIIQDDLNKLGMKVNLRPLDFNTLIGRSDTGDWDAIIIGFTGGFFEPNGGANVWKLDGRLHMFDNKPHEPRDWEIEIDRIFNEGVKVVEFEERKKYYDRFQEIVYDKLPFIYLASPLRVIAYQNDLGNVIPTIYGGVLHNIESVYKKNNH